jgi:hypothetical protein
MIDLGKPLWAALSALLIVGAPLVSEAGERSASQDRYESRSSEGTSYQTETTASGAQRPVYSPEGNVYICSQPCPDGAQPPPPIHDGYGGDDQGYVAQGYESSAPGVTVSRTETRYGPSSRGPIPGGPVQSQTYDYGYSTYEAGVPVSSDYSASYAPQGYTTPVVARGYAEQSYVEQGSEERGYVSQSTRTYSDDRGCDPCRREGDARYAQGYRDGYRDGSDDADVYYEDSYATRAPACQPLYDARGRIVQGCGVGGGMRVSEGFFYGTGGVGPDYIGGGEGGGGVVVVGGGGGGASAFASARASAGVSISIGGKGSGRPGHPGGGGHPGKPGGGKGGCGCGH